ncbi:hypothetical protein ACIBF1_32700 [Spirillospora sp. NPDC050679]
MTRRHGLSDAEGEFARPLLPVTRRGRKRPDDRRALDGAFDKVLRTTQADADATGEIDWQMPVDSTSVRAHQHATGARKGGCTSPVSGAPRAA